MTGIEPRRSHASAAGLSMKRLADFLLVASFVLLILVSSTQIKTFPPDAVEYTANFGEGNALRQFLYTISFLGAFFASRPLSIGWRIVSIPIPILLLLLFCAISVSWSDNPSTALRRLILTCMVLWTTFRCVGELGYRRALDVLTITLLVLLVLNYAYVLLTPNGIHHSDGPFTDTGIAGDWHGLVPHKNDTGPILAQTIILLIFGISRLKLAWRMIFILAAAYFLYRTHSKTSIGLIFVGLAVGAGFLRYRSAYRSLFVPALMIGGAALAYAIAIYAPSAIDSLDSSEDAFTGRIQIWRTMIAYIHDHWYLGAGFGSFWDVGSIGPANIYGRSWVAQMVTQGHNGYLDLWTQIGIFGLILAVLSLMIIPAIKLLVRTPQSRNHAAVVAGLLVFLFGHNFTESSMLLRDYFGNVMLAIIVASIYDITRMPRATASTGKNVRRPLPVTRS